MLHTIVDRVNSKEWFAEFLAALQADWEAGGRELEWENSNLGRFLEAMHAWIQDMDQRIPEQPSWRTFADILYAAKIYE